MLVALIKVAVDHIGGRCIAGGFLIAAHGPPAGPGQRVEPVERQQRLGQDICQQVMPAMVRQLMRDGGVDPALPVGTGARGVEQQRGLVVGDQAPVLM